MAQRVIAGRARGLVGVAVVSVAAAVGLSGCATSHALALVRQACRHVDSSLSLYQASTTTASGASAQADSAAALQQLRDALPLAATAAGENAQWDAFMTTLSETSRVPESDLVIALRQQCADVASGGQNSNTPPTTAAPVATNPQVGQ